MRKTGVLPPRRPGILFPVASPQATVKHHSPPSIATRPSPSRGCVPKKSQLKGLYFHGKKNCGWEKMRLEKLPAEKLLPVRKSATGKNCRGGKSHSWFTENAAQESAEENWAHVSHSDESGRQTENQQRGAIMPINRDQIMEELEGPATRTFPSR